MLWCCRHVKCSKFLTTSLTPRRRRCEDWRPTHRTGRALLWKALASAGLWTTHSLPALFWSSHFHHIQAMFDNIRLVSLEVLHLLLPLPGTFWPRIFPLTPCHSGFGSNVTSEESSCTIYSGFYYRIFQTMWCPKLTSWVSTNIFPFRSPGTEENNPCFSSFSHFIATGFLEFPSQMYDRAKWQGRGEQPTERRLSKMIKTCYQKEH